MWTKIAKESTVFLGYLNGFDVEEFVKTGEIKEGKRIELKIGVKEIQEYTDHLKRLYAKFGTDESGIDAILDDTRRQELHNKATESVIRNTFSPAVMKYYKSQYSGLTGLNFKIRQMINDAATEVIQYSLKAKFDSNIIIKAKNKLWININAYEIENKNFQDHLSEVSLEDNFAIDDVGEEEIQFFGFDKNRQKQDTEKNEDKSPVLSEEDSIRRDNAPAVDDYGNSRLL